MSRIKLFFCAAVLIGASLLFADPSEAMQPNRLYDLCKDLFTQIEKPLLFKLERGGKKALLFGTTTSSATLDQFPAFVLEAVKSAKVVGRWSSQRTDSSQIEMEKFEALIESGEPYNLEDRLEPKLRALYQNYMEMISPNPYLYPFFTPQMASEALMMVYRQLTASDAEKLQALGLELDHRFSELDPPATTEENLDLMNRLNLEMQVAELAIESGAQHLPLMAPEIKDGLLPEGPDGLETVKNLLLQMEKVIGSGFTMPSYHEVTVEDLDKSAEMNAKLLPSAVMESLVINRSLTALMEQAIEENEGVLFDLDSLFLGGRVGILQLLKNAGFKIEQITSEQQWLEFKPGI